MPTFESAIAAAIEALRVARDLAGAQPVVVELEHFAERLADLPAEEAGWHSWMETCCGMLVLAAVASVRRRPGGRNVRSDDRSGG